MLQVRHRLGITRSKRAPDMARALRLVPWWPVVGKPELLEHGKSLSTVVRLAETVEADLPGWGE